MVIPHLNQPRNSVSGNTKELIRPPLPGAFRHKQVVPTAEVKSDLENLFSLFIASKKLEAPKASVEISDTVLGNRAKRSRNGFRVAPD